MQLSLLEISPVTHASKIQKFEGSLQFLKWVKWQEKHPKSPKFQEKVNGPRKSCLKNICQKCLVNLLFLKPNGCKTDSNHPLSNWILKFWKHFFTRLEINLHIPELNCKHKAKQKETKDKKLKKGECLNYDLLQVKKSTLKVTPIQKSGCR